MGRKIGVKDREQQERHRAGVGRCVRTQEQEIVGGGSTQLGWAACRATEIPD